MRDFAGAELAWVSLCTFSKAYGLAWARVGYGLCSSAALTQVLRKTRNPFAVNAFAGAAALAALGDAAHLTRTTALARAEPGLVAQALKALGHDVAPSQANFLFFHTGGPASVFCEGMRQRCVLLKCWQETSILDWARLSFATPEKSDIFLGNTPD